MTKRRMLRWSLLLVIVAGFAVWLEPTRVVWGWLRGEASYRGRPTSWWAGQIAAWEFDHAFQARQFLPTRPKKKALTVPEFNENDLPMLIFTSETAFVFNYRLRRDSLRDWLERFVKVPARPWPAILDGAADAEPVLRELQSHGDPFVQDWATIGLERLETLEKGPRLTLWLERTRRTDPVHVPGKDFSAADMQEMLLP